VARPKALISWSTGKDGAWALHAVRAAGEVEVVAALTTVTATFDRVSMHGVRTELLARQLDAAGLPGIEVAIPSPCPNDVYEREMGAALAEARARGITHVVFGDLFLEDLRAYREARLAEVGFTGLFPLWKRDTRQLAREMVAGGLAATLTCVDPRVLDRSFAGRSFDAGLLEALPEGVDPCGENGEFHTFCWDGPMFRHPVPVRTGDVVERDGFVFADVLPGVARYDRGFDAV
jgi:uncharacterized protein (TIGR00290 family)